MGGSEILIFPALGTIRGGFREEEQSRLGGGTLGDGAAAGGLFD
jgi:hypothetical protein